MERRHELLVAAVIFVVFTLAESTIYEEATATAPVPIVRIRDDEFRSVIPEARPSVPPGSVPLRHPAEPAVEATQVPSPAPSPKPVKNELPKSSVGKASRPAGLPNNVATSDVWQHDSEVSWYGPGFYGHRTACGYAFTTTILGVANRSLPCGTLIEFRWAGRTAVVPVIDRGPYVRGRDWDLSGGLCTLLEHCFTGPIDWRFVH